MSRELDAIEARVADINVPLSYADELYALRGHLLAAAIELSSAGLGEADEREIAVPFPDHPAGVDSVFPNGQARARGAPDFHGLGVGPGGPAQPIQKIEKQGVGDPWSGSGLGHLGSPGA